MIDRFGRNIEYLRLSLTERCTLRCAYCRAAEGVCPKQDELSAAEFLRIARAMAGLGVKKVRLTGGEPMLRRDLTEIVAGLRALPGIEEIAMTTNGQHLPGKAKVLREAGLDRLNISVDSLRADRYRELTGGGEFSLVLSGIDEALHAGFSPLKLNAVLMRGRNDDEVPDFIALTKDRPIDVRFIELMPLGTEDHTDERVTGDEILKLHPELIPLPPRYAGQPSRDYHVEGYVGRVGLISPVSHKFCKDCNRVRVMSDGMLRPCLGDNAEVPLKDALASGDDDVLLERIQSAIWNKPETHGFDGAFSAARDMSRIGG